MVWSSGVFWKGAGSGSYVSWHQDATNFELDDPERVVRAWVALTPATLTNGTMRFLPRGHRLGQVRHLDRKRAGELLSRGETMDMVIDETVTVPVLIDAGEVSFHHLHSPHASGPNDSDQPRVNYVMTFIDPRVAPRVGPDSAMLVRGVDGHGHFESEPRPKQHLDANALRAHKRFMAMRYAILFRGAKAPPPPPHAI
jgi:ectoine hydroxylase-related dioxygenase (phytanoyl-CoA dioxygenase family)